MMIYPYDDLKQRGFYTFEYYIRSNDGSELKKQLTVKIIDLEDSFEVGSGEIDPESNSLEVYVHNREDVKFDSVDAKFNSAFFNFNENFALEPNERKNFAIKLEKEDFKKLLAGFYTFTSDLSVEGKTAKLKGTIEFVEKNILTSKEEYYGGVVNTEIIEKKNEGNVIANTNTVIKKNIISRLFTTFNPEPDLVERQGIHVYFTWNRDVNPGEILTIKVKTNWFFPLIIIILLGVIVFLAKQFKRTDLVLRKRANFVRTKGGEFALKISLSVHAKKDLERVQIIDKLPSLVKVFEKFGSERPKRINEKARRIEWDFDSLNDGETRVLSYIIYSKIGVLGKFLIPEATGVYEKNGKIHETQSNKTFFIAEQKKGEVEEKF